MLYLFSTANVFINTLLPMPSGKVSEDHTGCGLDLRIKNPYRRHIVSIHIFPLPIIWMSALQWHQQFLFPGKYLGLLFNDTEAR